MSIYTLMDNARVLQQSHEGPEIHNNYCEKWTRSFLYAPPSPGERALTLDYGMRPQLRNSKL